jgi:hypothetical protein
MDGGELFEDDLLVAGADPEEKIGLTEEGEAKGLVIDAGGEFVFPGEDVGDTEAGTFGLALEKCELFGQGKGDLFIPIIAEMLQEVAGSGAAQEKSGDDPFADGHGPEGVTEAIVTIDEAAEELAVAGAHLFVVAEKVFQPGVQGHFAFVGIDDGGRIAELVIEFHLL